MSRKTASSHPNVPEEVGPAHGVRVPTTRPLLWRHGVPTPAGALAYIDGHIHAAVAKAEGLSGVEVNHLKAVCQSALKAYIAEGSTDEARRLKDEMP